MYSIATGLARAAKAEIVAAFGCTLGVLPHMIAANTGLAALFNSSAVAFQTVKWLGITRPKVIAWLRRTLAATYLLMAGQLAVESR